MRLQGKKILLGISGSIAAFKSVFLLRLLIKEGAQVQVVITPSGKEFVTPVTLSALSGKPVISEFFGKSDGTWHSHVDLGLWADAFMLLHRLLLQPLENGQWHCRQYAYHHIYVGQMPGVHCSCHGPRHVCASFNPKKYRHSERLREYHSRPGSRVNWPAASKGKAGCRNRKTWWNMLAESFSQKKNC
jgi:hypothetical protein